MATRKTNKKTKARVSTIRKLSKKPKFTIIGLALVVLLLGVAGYFVLKSHAATAYYDYSVTWGQSGDKPVPCHYIDFSSGNGKNQAEVATWRPSNGTWYVKSPDGNNKTVQWGALGDIPLPGQLKRKANISNRFICDYVVWRPSNGTWYVRNSQPEITTGNKSVSWGISGDIPIYADYNGDGYSDFIIYRPSEGKWYIKDGVTLANFPVISWGTKNDGSNIPLITKDSSQPGQATLTIFNKNTAWWWPYGKSLLYFGKPYFDTPMTYQIFGPQSQWQREYIVTRYGANGMEWNIRSITNNLKF